MRCEEPGVMSVIPTRVGVNRGPAEDSALGPSDPHACGGEPKVVLRGSTQST